MDHLNGQIKQPSLREVREQRKLVKARLEAKQLEREQRLLESLSMFGTGWGTYVDMWNRVVSDRDELRGGAPLSTLQDRRLGRNYPIFQSEQELAILRAPARILCSTNAYAIGLMNGLTSYVVGTGFNHQVVPRDDRAGPDLVKKCQDVLDEFREHNDCASLEQELFWRWREDGEFFLNHFLDRDTGLTELRTVEPEQIWRPADQREEWSFGCLNKPGDEQTILKYYVRYLSRPDKDGFEVDARDMVHLKANVKRIIKRGLTDFCFSTLDTLDVADRLRKAIGESAAVQAAIAEIVEYENATKAQVQSLVDSQIDSTTTHPLTGKTVNHERIEPGTRRHIPKGMKYVPPPGAGNGTIPAYIEALQACLRAAGVRHSAPEWLASSDASNNNFASSLTAESPFVLSVKRMQAAFGRKLRESDRIALRNAARAGRLPPNILQLVDVEVSAPPIEMRDRLKEAQTDQVYVGMGAKSVQEVQREIGVDPEQMATERSEWLERFGPLGPELELPGDMGTGLSGDRQPDQGGDPASDGDLSPEGGDQAAGLRATVGGSQAVGALQRSYYAGELPREAAVANARIVFGFDQAAAEALFPEKAPVKLVPDGAVDTGAKPPPAAA